MLRLRLTEQSSPSCDHAPKSIETPEKPLSPTSLNTIAFVYIALSVASCLFVAADIFFAGRRQKMGVMEAVWPLTMLYWGPLGLPFYFGFGREEPSRSPMRAHSHGAGESEPPTWQAVFKGAAHCGAGCALGDFAAEWIVLGLGLALRGSTLAASSR